MSFKEYPKWVEGVLVNDAEEEKIVAGKVTKTKQVKQHTEKEAAYKPAEYPKWVGDVVVNNAEEEEALSGVDLGKMTKGEIEQYALDKYDVNLNTSLRKDELIAEVEALGG